MMKLLTSIGLGLAMSTSAMAQTADMQAQTKTVVTPVTPPATMVTQVAPDAFVVTPVPGVVTATKVKVQNFSDYDRNGNGVYSPMEFAQALYFLATTDPVAGNPTLPAWDMYNHRGTPQEMKPGVAVTLLNTTADEFAMVDMNNDWRISPTELTAFAML